MTVSSLPDPAAARDDAARRGRPDGAAPQRPPLTIRAAGDSDRTRWDRFVDASPAGTFFHRYAWSDVLQRAFGYEPHYLLAAHGADLAGVLPLVHKKSALFGDAMISLPFCSYGGPLAATPAVTDALASRAVELATQLKADYVELRGGVPADTDWVSVGDAYATFELPLPPTPDAIIAAIPRKGRKHAVRQSLKAGLTFAACDDLGDFYAVLSESYRNLGTPIFPRRYFESLASAFPNAFRAYVVHHAGAPVAASLAFAYRDHLHPLYAGGTAAARTLNASDFLFYKLMCTALDEGLTRFDFGRSKAGTGSFAYKKHWGFEPRFLVYGQKLVHGKSLPDLSPLNPRYRALIGAWKRLPLAVSRALGPHLIRHLG